MKVCELPSVSPLFLLELLPPYPSSHTILNDIVLLSLYIHLHCRVLHQGPYLLFPANSFSLKRFNFIFNWVYIVEKGACPCGSLIRIWKKVDGINVSIFFFFLCLLAVKLHPHMETGGGAAVIKPWKPGSEEECSKGDTPFSLQHLGKVHQSRPRLVIPVLEL